MAIDEALAAIPGVEVNFTQPMAMRLDEVVSGVKADVAVKIFGPDAADARALGEQVRSGSQPVSRSRPTCRSRCCRAPSQIEIDIDRDAAARYALNVADVQELVETAIGGTQATEILDGARRFAVVVRLPDQVHARPRRDRRADADGSRRREGAAVVDRRPSASRTSPEAINHESGERRLVVQSNVRGRDVGQLRRRGAAAAGVDLRPAGRLLPHLGRAVREPAAGDAAADARHPAVARHHLPAALRDVRARAPGPARHPERPVRAGRRRRRAVDPRAHAEPLGVGRLHRPVRRRGAQRRRA